MTNARTNKRSKTTNFERMHERIDVDALMHMNELELEPELEMTVSMMADPKRKQLTNRKGDGMPTTRTAITYRPKGKEYAKDARMYADEPGLQRLVGWCSRILSYKFYHDIDIANCSPTLLWHIVRTKLDIPCPVVEQYVVNRSAVFTELRAENEQCRKLSNKQMKQLFLIGLHGGRHSSRDNLIKYGFPSGTIVPMLENWENTIKKLIKKLMRLAEYNDLKVGISKDDEKENKVGTFAALVWQQLENSVLLHLYEYFKKTAYRPGVLKYDGIMVEKKAGDNSICMEESIVRNAEASVFQKFGIQHFRLVDKSPELQPTAADWLKYNGPKSIYRIPDKDRRQTYIVTQFAKERFLKRYDEHTMKPHPSIPGVYIQDEKNDDFMNKILKEYEFAETRSMKNMCEWFNSNDHKQFELLTDAKMRRDVISFENGFLNIDTMIFTLWTDLGDVLPPLTNHYYDQIITQKDAPTPLWTNMLKTQLKTDEMVNIFEVLIGRQFYSLGKYDNWQVMLYMMGDSGTGKSTICDVVRALFPKGSVGSITSTFEKTFGLDGLCDKRLVQIPDVPEKLSKVLDQQMWQSMVTGEPVAVGKKHKKASTEKQWKTPLMASANYLPDYKDTGQVARRLALFKFETCVSGEADTLLKEKIVESELVTILLRSIIRYRDAVKEHKSQGFWNMKITPAELKDNKEGISIKMNSLGAFIANGDDRYQVVHKEGCVTSLTKLNMIYSKHMLNVRKIPNATIGTDYQAITSAGFVKRELNMCKECDMPCTKQNCGDHYNSKNRTQKVAFLNMEIIIKEGYYNNAVEPIPYSK